MTGVWIASTSWAIHHRLTSLPNIQTVGTIIAFTDRTQTLDLLTPYTRELFIKLSEENAKMSPPEAKSGNPDNPCPQCWNLSTANISLVTDPAVKNTGFSVYAAIYSVAQALHNLLGCNSTACMQGSETKIYPWKVIYLFSFFCYECDCRGFGIKIVFLTTLKLNNEIFFAAVGGFKEYVCRHKWHTFRI